MTGLSLARGHALGGRCAARAVLSSSRLIAILAIGGLALNAACHKDPHAASRQHAARADAFVRDGKLPEATIEYRSALQFEPHNGEVRIKLANVYLRAGDFVKGLQEYVRAAEVRPNDARTQIKTGTLLLVAGRYAEAGKYADQALVLEPRNLEARLLKANALAGVKNIDAAIAQIEDAIRSNPDRGATYSNLGALELSRGRREAAEAAFKKAAEISPDAISVHLALGNFYWVTGQWAQADRALHRALEIDPDDAIANRAYANLCLATNRMKEAEAPLKRIYEATKRPAEAFALADYYVAMRNAPAARAVLDPLTHDHDTAGEANVRLAALEYRTGHHDEAYRRLRTAIALDAGNVKAHLVQASCLLQDGKADDALASVEVATKNAPNDTAAFFLLGRIQTARHDVEDAIAAFETVLRLNPRATDAKLHLARLQLAHGQPATSVALASEAIASQPNNPDARLLLVRALIAHGETDKASAALDALVKRFPKSAAVQTQLGMIRGQQKRTPEARAHFERALQLAPDSIDALIGLSALDLGAGKAADARKRLDQRIAAHPTAPLLTLAARVRAMTGDPASAETFLRQALERDDAYLPAYIALGQLYMKERRLADARAEFEGVGRRAARPVAAQTIVGMLWEAEGKIAEAQAQYERVLQIDPGAPVAANNLAWILARGQTPNLDLALDFALRASRRLPDSPSVNDTLGYIYYKKDLASMAIPLLTQAVDKDPENAVYHYHLGLAEMRAQRTLDGRESLARALQLNPRFAGAQDARDMLAGTSTSAAAPGTP